MISSLSLEERQNLLHKLKGQSNLTNEPLYFDETETPLGDMETEYSNLPWYYRLWYYILSFFKEKTPLKIFEDKQVTELGNKIEEKTPGLYDCQNNLLLPPFYRLAGRLKESAHFFYSALDSSVNRDRGGFFAFLGSLEMADVHKRLQEETDPAYIIEKEPDTQETELRQKAFKAMDDALAMVTEEYRNVMYFNARSLFCLKELSSFLYDRMLMAFNFNNSVNGETCSGGIIRELLASLNNILISLKKVPPMTLLESLFIFILQEKVADPGFDINREIRSLLAKAEDSITVIREFNRQVPLTWIIRCSNRDLSYSPREISGGEDWFVLYRDHWKRRVETLFSDYMRERRQKELMDTFRYFLKGKSYKPLSNTQTDTNPDGLPVRGAFALSFLQTFYSAVFMPDINWILRPILIDGEFKNNENRIEFAEAYNNLIKLDDEIKKFEGEISPEGEYGKRYAQAKQDMSSLPVKRRKTQIVLEEAREDSGKILGRAREASNTMILILSGILGKGYKSKYDTLSNLPKLAGRDNQFLAGMGEAIQKFQTVLKLLDEMEAMEAGR